MNYTLEELEEKTPDELNIIMKNVIENDYDNLALIRDIFLVINQDALTKYDISHIVENGEMESLKLLFANGYVVIPEYIDIVCKNMHADGLQILLGAGGNPDDVYDINSPLMTLVQRLSDRTEEIFKRCSDLLLKHGADINYKRDNFKYTALHFAVIAKKKYAIKYLLDNGADTSVEDSDGETPWDLAINQIRTEFPELEPKSM